MKLARLPLTDVQPASSTWEIESFGNGSYNKKERRLESPWENLYSPGKIQNYFSIASELIALNKNYPRTQQIPKNNKIISIEIFGKKIQIISLHSNIIYNNNR